MGRPKKTDFTYTYSLRLNDEEKKKLQDFAWNNRLTVNDALRSLIQKLP